jgi:Cof subfamily protein (haloacid dehalogenase superfamily)
MKLLVTDLDGTILDENHSLSDETLKVLKEFKSIGYDITFATGRSTPSALPFIKRANIELPVILFNGCMIFDPRRLKPMRVHYLGAIASNVAEKIPRYVSQMIFTEDGIYLMNPSEGLEGYLQRDKIKYEVLSSIREIDLDNVVKMMLVGLKEVLDDLYEELQFIDEASIVRSEDDLIEIIPKGVNKGTALLELSEILGVDLKDIVAIGDSMNDIEMIRLAGLGVAVGNAREPVKIVADVTLKGERHRAFRELFEYLRV